jgi:thioesterase domain-containing protein
MFEVLQKFLLVTNDDYIEGNDAMPDTPELAAIKSAQLEEYLRDRRSQATKRTIGSYVRPSSINVSGSRTHAMPIQVQGSKQPFFFLHGDWTKNAYFCFPLARGLGTKQPFYNLEPYSFEELTTLPSLEAMAAAHIRSVRSIQPEGPYQIGGFCNGGLIAYEMARQLHAEGQKVDLLVLMDVIPARLTSLCGIIRFIGKLLHCGEDKQINWFLRLTHAARYVLDRHSEDFEYIKKTDPKICSFFPPLETLRKEYPAMFIWATSGYRPGFYPGKVTLFWNEAEPERRTWWNKWARGKDNNVEMHIIAGTHTTCKTDYLHDMAKHLRECLSKV